MSRKTCKTDGCKKERAKNRTVCHSCKYKRYRDKNPMRVAWLKQRRNAKGRRKQHDLTFDQFKALAVATDYMKNKGRTATCYHIDRIDETKGYTAGNVQVLTNSDNVKKYRVSLTRDYDEKAGKMLFFTAITKEPEPPTEDDCPF